MWLRRVSSGASRCAAPLRRCWSSDDGRAASTKLPRTPLQWQHEDFYDEAKFEREFRRVLDICHGCRRCFNLCNAFPALFDAIDASPTGELDSVPTHQLHVVNDQCTLCDMCFTAKCPYVPPHEFNLDFPHLVLRYRAIEQAASNRKAAAAHGAGLESGPWLDAAHVNAPPPEVQQGVARELTLKPARVLHRVLSNQNIVGPAGSVLAPLANAVTQTPGSLPRKALEAATGIDANAVLPAFSSETFVAWYAKQPPPPKEAARKVVLYVSCFVNHNRPEIGRALVALLRASDVKVRVSFPGCCGMPQLEQGLVGEVSSRAAAVAAELASFVHQGYRVVSLTPSCTLMLKQEWPLLLRDSADVRCVAEHTSEATEYLVELYKAGALVAGVPAQPLDAVSVTLHNACHARAQNVGFKARELLSVVPGLSVTIADRCSGHGGTWGFHQGHQDTAHRVGAPVVAAAAAAARSATASHVVVSECPLAADHLLQGLHKRGVGNAARLSPVELVAQAYRLSYLR